MVTFVKHPYDCDRQFALYHFLLDGIPRYYLRLPVCHDDGKRFRFPFWHEFSHDCTCNYRSVLGFLSHFKLSLISHARLWSIELAKHTLLTTPLASVWGQAT